MVTLPLSKADALEAARFVQAAVNAGYQLTGRPPSARTEGLRLFKEAHPEINLSTSGFNTRFRIACETYGFKIKEPKKKKAKIGESPEPPVGATKLGGSDTDRRMFALQG